MDIGGGIRDSVKEVRKKFQSSVTRKKGFIHTWKYADNFGIS